MPSVVQSAFVYGELSPDLHSRVEKDFYRGGLAECKNFIVQKEGGLVKRPGTSVIVERVGEGARLIPFVFRADDTYMLLFEPPSDDVAISDSNRGKVRVIRNGSLIREDLDDADSEVYEIDFPEGFGYNKVWITCLDYTQAGDVLTLTCPSLPPITLTRYNHNDWRFAVLDFSPLLLRPKNTAVEVKKTGNRTFRYAVSAVDRDTGIEGQLGQTRLPFSDDPFDATWLSNFRAEPYGEPLSSGRRSLLVRVNSSSYRRIFELVKGELTGIWYRVVVRYGSPVRFLNAQLYGRFYESNGLVDSFYLGASATSASLYEIRSVQTEDISDTSYDGVFIFNSASANWDNVITWDTLPETPNEAYGREGYTYRIYRYDDDTDTWGFIGTSEDGSFQDEFIDPPDTTRQPVVHVNPFESADDYPSVSTYFKQRRVFAHTTVRPFTAWLSVIRAYSNFSVHTPQTDSDAITADIANNFDPIRHLVPLESLLAFTDSEVYALSGVDGLITPTSIRIDPQTSYGVVYEEDKIPLKPLRVGDDVVYMARGYRTRALAYTFEADKYRGGELSIYTRHLIGDENPEHKITSWAYAQNPDDVVWLTREDGVLLGITFVREQDVVAWHRHETEGGLFKQVETVREGDNEAVYFIVARGEALQVERLNDGSVAVGGGAERAFYMDAGEFAYTASFTALPMEIPVAQLAALSQGYKIDASAASLRYSGGAQGLFYEVFIDGRRDSVVHGDIDNKEDNQGLYDLKVEGHDDRFVSAERNGRAQIGSSAGLRPQFRVVHNAPEALKVFAISYDYVVGRDINTQRGDT